MMRFARASIVVVIVFGSIGASSPHALTVRVVGLRSDRGGVVCRLFANGEGFPSRVADVTERRAKIVRDAAHSGLVATCTFAMLPFGDYAIAVFHDENDNGKLDTNFLGLPAEGVGVSNNRFPILGPPSWSDARFSLDHDIAMEVVPRY